MILSVHIQKELGWAFVTDLENGVTWSKEDLEKVLNIIEENNLQLELGDNYIALKDAYAAIITAEKIVETEEKESEDK